MPSPPLLHPDLMPSLRQLVRGLELLFWALPFVLLVCVQEILAPEWESWGVMPLFLSTVILWFGASRLRYFQPQEKVWQSSVKVTEILALLMAGEEGQAQNLIRNIAKNSQHAYQQHAQKAQEVYGWE